VCALAVWSTRFGDLDRLPAELEAAGYTRTASFGGSRSLWQKHVCDPT
ncbi:MAG: hypothetical protein H0U26_03450, partial [Acidimicrobiia bacterium]|nr:hypothetical protein [Acidimicrobiia bacterium]